MIEQLERVLEIADDFVVTKGEGRMNVFGGE